MGRPWVSISTFGDEATARWADNVGQVVVTVGPAMILLDPAEARSLASQLDSAADQAALDNIGGAS